MQGTTSQTTSFDLGGGAPCLDFVNTLDDRPAPAPFEQLTSYEELLAFAAATGSITASEANTLLHAATRNHDTASSVLQWAIELREALYRILRSRLDSVPLDPADLATLNEAIADAGVHEHLERPDEQFRMAWKMVDDDGSVHLDRPLWPIARSAALLLTSQLPGTLRACAADDCAVLFLDTTRNHSRRWCSRSGCGNRERVRQFRQRHADRQNG